MVDPTEALVTERQKTHGHFAETADAAQRLKRQLRLLTEERARRGRPLTDTQLESLDLICTKIGRIISGDASLQEHWDDIAGYAKIANGSF